MAIKYEKRYVCDWCGKESEVTLADDRKLENVKSYPAHPLRDWYEEKTVTTRTETSKKFIFFHEHNKVVDIQYFHFCCWEHRNNFEACRKANGNS